MVIVIGWVFSTVSPESRRYVANGLLYCSCCQLFMTVCTKSSFMHRLGATTDDPDAFISGEVVKEDVLTDDDAITELNPVVKGVILLHCGWSVIASEQAVAAAVR